MGRGEIWSAMRWGIHEVGSEGGGRQTRPIGVEGTEKSSKICMPLRTRASCEVDPEGLGATLEEAQSSCERRKLYWAGEEGVVSLYTG